MTDLEAESLAPDSNRKLLVLDDLRQMERRAVSSRVASIIAHLIGTPLHVIAGRASLIRTASSDPSVDENARRIEEQVERLAQRIRGLIDYLTTPESGGSNEESAKAVVASALSLYVPIAAQRGVTLRQMGEAPSGSIDGSALIVLTSLLSLASRAAGEGATCELSLGSDSKVMTFDLSIPGLSPPRGRLDTLEPPEHPDKNGFEELQVLSLCYAMAKRTSGKIEVLTSSSAATIVRYTAVLRA
ncbi:MAG TPA: histidine kinase dimerization/phospho-acceptor domain-containing protein [Polyangiaceae bacterium]|jgi:signal transduction histidine kinase|nr:histidine kinase dimerization/phospho-acceptor domain-containing protein [Polyangiaceae bacterium]